MSGYVALEWETDRDALIERMLDALQVAFPNWEPSEADPVQVLVEEFAQAYVESGEVMVNVAAAIFRAFGPDLIELEVIDGAPATMLSTWTAVDDAGYTIPAGTLVAYRNTGSDLWGFHTVTDVTVPAGSTETTNVELEASEPGTLRNGVPNGSALELVDALSFISGVVTTSQSGGGVDPETDDEYRDRLRAELRLLAPRPILPDDFATLSRRTEGVYRAVVLDGYDPVAETFENERMVAIAAVDEDGNTIGASVKLALDADMQARREVNFVVHVIDPEYTDVNVTFEAVAEDSYDPADVLARAEQAVADYLDPASWGGGDESPPRWTNETTVRLYEIAHVLESVEGLRYVSLLEMGKDGGAQAAADVSLDGVAPLPSRVEVDGSTVDGTVS